MTPRPLQRRYVAYFRVSPARQGRSGLGLAAQRRAVEDFIAATGGTLVSESTEVQSGKDDNRTELAKALNQCRLTRATLLIAKLDRLSRDAAFLLTLQKSQVRFVACDLPDMNETMVGLLAVIAQAERKAISDRTKAALQAAKRRGVKLGNPHLQPGTARTARIATAAAQAKAQARAEDLRATVEDAMRKGLRSLRQIADHLMRLEIETPRGGRDWTGDGVRRLLRLLGSTRAPQHAARA